MKKLSVILFLVMTVCVLSAQESIDWMKSVISLRSKNEKLIEKYYKKILKECPAVIAMQFFQIESYVLAGIPFTAN